MTTYSKNYSTRDGIITNMCYTWDHAFGMSKDEWGQGYTNEERHALWNRMAQIFDNDIAPCMQFKEK